MNKLSIDRRAALVSALVEGNSIRATARMTDTPFNTVLKFVADIGTVCREYLDETMKNLPCRRLQADEIWQFCYAKSRNVPETLQGQFGYGDVWTWVAIDADTKLVPTFLVGTRDARWAFHFINDLPGRLSNRVQLTTDGNHAYLFAVPMAFDKIPPSTMPSSLSSTELHSKGRLGTAPRFASEPARKPFRGIRSLRTSRRAMLSAKI